MEKKTNKSRLFGLLFFVIALGIFTMSFVVQKEPQPVAAMLCNHSDVKAVSAKNATCTEDGEIDRVCKNCGKVLKKLKVLHLGHDMGEYVITTKPTSDADGIETSTCTRCGKTLTRTYKCMHDNVKTISSVGATCEEDGTSETICKDCGKVIHTDIIPKLGHIFGSWITTVEATPISSGTQSRSCQICGKTETKDYTMEMDNNMIYIPGTGINHYFVQGPMDQSIVDNNDMVYAYAYDWGCGENDPFILGHNYNTLGLLKNTKVGQNIYVKINGVVKTYRVFISEFAMQTDNKKDIIGQTSGYSIFDTFGTETLHMYTCDKRAYNGRWIVFATLI